MRKFSIALFSVIFGLILFGCGINNSTSSIVISFPENLSESLVLFKDIKEPSRSDQKAGFCVRVNLTGDVQNTYNFNYSSLSDLNSAQIEIPELKVESTVNVDVDLLYDSTVYYKGKGSDSVVIQQGDNQVDITLKAVFDKADIVCYYDDGKKEILDLNKIVFQSGYLIFAEKELNKLGFYDSFVWKLNGEVLDSKTSTVTFAPEKSSAVKRYEQNILECTATRGDVTKVFTTKFTFAVIKEFELSYNYGDQEYVSSINNEDIVIKAVYADGSVEENSAHSYYNIEVEDVYGYVPVKVSLISDSEVKAKMNVLRKVQMPESIQTAVTFPEGNEIYQAPYISFDVKAVVESFGEGPGFYLKPDSDLIEFDSLFEAVSYQWYVNNELIEEEMATKAKYTVNNKEAGEFKYFCAITVKPKEFITSFCTEQEAVFSTEPVTIKVLPVTESSINIANLPVEIKIESYIASDESNNQIYIESKEIPKGSEITWIFNGVEISSLKNLANFEVDNTTEGLIAGKNIIEVHVSWGNWMASGSIDYDYKNDGGTAF